jgi:hypothetical protein
MAFKYEILVARSNTAAPSGIVWHLGSTMQPLNPNLILVLNQMGQQGWEVVAIGNLGFDMGNEILLKKQA